MLAYAKVLCFRLNPWGQDVNLPVLDDIFYWTNLLGRGGKDGAKETKPKQIPS